MVLTSTQVPLFNTHDLVSKDVPIFFHWRPEARLSFSLPNAWPWLFFN